MTDCSSTTTSIAFGTVDRAFSGDTEAFDAVIDTLHTAIDAEALVGSGSFDPAIAGLAREAATAWAVCEDGVTRFLGRPSLCADHVMAAEHLADVLRSGGIGEVHAFVVPAALMRAAGRNARLRDARSVILARQLAHLGAVLRVIIEEARDSEWADAGLSDDPDEIVPVA